MAGSGQEAGGKAKEEMMLERVATGKGLKGRELVEWRQQYVAEAMLAHKSVRQIEAELKQLAAQGVGGKCSRGTVGHDVQVVRARWAEDRKKAVDELVGEELARLRRLEERWWGVATEDGVEAEAAAGASERVLAIMRQRAALLGLSGGGKAAVQVTAGAVAGAAGGVNTEGPLPAGAQVKVLVEYVDDRRDLEKYG